MASSLKRICDETYTRMATLGSFLSSSGFRRSIRYKNVQGETTISAVPLMPLAS